MHQATTITGEHSKPKARSCKLTDLPLSSSSSQEEFLDNLGAAGKALQETLPRVIAFVAGKWYHEL